MAKAINLLFFGDLIGRAGRVAFTKNLLELRKQYQADFVVVNGENAAGGSGISKRIANAVFRFGADVITLGDHAWDQRETLEHIVEETRLLRPYNYPEGTPGNGYKISELVTTGGEKLKIATLVLQGKAFLKSESLRNPFQIAHEVVAEIRKETPIIFVDFHAEASSEKSAIGWHLDGLVSAIAGTHTHTQTADAQILPNGTAFISDVGMCGPKFSVIGRKIEPVLKRFMTGLPTRMDIAEGVVLLCGLYVKIDRVSGKALETKSIRLEVEDPLRS